MTDNDCFLVTYVSCGLIVVLLKILTVFVIFYKTSALREFFSTLTKWSEHNSLRLNTSLGEIYSSRLKETIYFTPIYPDTRIFTVNLVWQFVICFVSIPTQLKTLTKILLHPRDTEVWTEETRQLINFRIKELNQNDLTSFRSILEETLCSREESTGFKFRMNTFLDRHFSIA